MIIAAWHVFSVSKKVLLTKFLFFIANFILILLYDIGDRLNADIDRWTRICTFQQAKDAASEALVPLR
jgi:4-amino-4-deoxy-L-arabinose transferase-like glycosyltransferase